MLLQGSFHMQSYFTLLLNIISAALWLTELHRGDEETVIRSVWTVTYSPTKSLGTSDMTSFTSLTYLRSLHLSA